MGRCCLLQSTEAAGDAGGRAGGALPPAEANVAELALVQLSRSGQAARADFAAQVRLCDWA